MSTTAKAEDEIIFYKASEQLEQGNILGAFDLLQQLIISYPLFGKAYYLLGFIYFNKFNDSINAEINNSKSIELTPEFAPAHLLRAELYIENDQYVLAIASLNKALHLTGVKKDRVNFLMGLINELQSDFDSAIELYKKAILFSLSDDDIALFEKAINRCIIKKKYAS